MVHGAGHEGGRRAGTENIILAVGLGQACELAGRGLPGQEQIKKLRDYFWQELKKYFSDKVVLNGHGGKRRPNTLNVSFVGKIGREILARIPRVAASTGSACHAGVVQLSPVLQAMGVSDQVGLGTIRFSLGKYTTREELDLTLKLLQKKS